MNSNIVQYGSIGWLDWWRHAVEHVRHVGRHVVWHAARHVVRHAGRGNLGIAVNIRHFDFA